MTSPLTENYPPKRSSRNPRTITWLHLSDLHSCNPKTNWDARRVLKSLKGDLQQMGKKYGLTPDLIFFTGDAAFGQIGKGKGETLADQFDDAHCLFEEVRQAFHPSVPHSNVFLVPGNHDVDRGEVTQEQTEWLRQADVSTVTKLIQEAGSRWAGYMERLKAYKEFLKQRRYEHLLGDPDRLIYAQTREVCGLKIGIAGFNSAWSCSPQDEKGRLWLGGDWQEGVLTSQLDEADFKIALIHHPLNWFVKQEDPKLSRLIEREFAFCLHGHLHQEWVEESSDGHTRIAAAACYERSDRENGYNFVRLSLETGLGEVWLRRFDSDGGGWVQRNISGKTDDFGMLPLRHVRLKSMPAEPTSSERRPLSGPGFSQQSQPNADSPVCDVCVFCALPEEADAVREVFSELSDVKFVRDFTSMRTAYYKATIRNGREEPLTIHLSCLPEMGGMRASPQFQAMLAEFKPRFAGLTGICAADRGVAALGDLVIANLAYEYGTGKIVSGEDGNPKLKPNIETFGPNDNIIQCVRHFEEWKDDVAALPRPKSKQQQADWLLSQLLNPKTPRIIDIPTEQREINAPL
jgi:predicted MPP superfamily phosphohydrolase